MISTGFKISEYNTLKKKDKIKVFIGTKFICGDCNYIYDINFNKINHRIRFDKYNYYTIQDKHHKQKKYFEFS